MSSMIRMNSAHDENISFCPASGSAESPRQPSVRWLDAGGSLTTILRICFIIGLSFCTRSECQRNSSVLERARHPTQKLIDCVANKRSHSEEVEKKRAAS